MQTLAQLQDGSLKGAKALRLSCGLSKFPDEIFTLANTLEILDLSGNKLSALPDDLPRLKKLRIIFCSNNQFTELPEVLGRCDALSMVGFKANQIKTVKPQALPKQLRWLILTDNEIESIPPEIGRCHALQKLMLAGNSLSTLPETLAYCDRLELLRISANQFNELPTCLFSMPRLSWLAFNGNPITVGLEQKALIRSPVESINWNEFTMDEKLGEGASGIISKATWTNSTNQQIVAVKVFKGAVTSDGLPESEIAACLSLAKHSNLTEVTGKVSDHPEQAQGLVLQLIPDHYMNLSGPPDFDTCTRDVYFSETRFTWQAVVKLLKGMVSAVAHLHRQGVLHGDLYAHNILFAKDGDAILGDFGAASLFDPKDIYGQSLQKIEARAFGCLIEELLCRCDIATAHAGLHAVLLGLKDACLHFDPAVRPTFESMEITLCGAIDYRYA